MRYYVVADPHGFYSILAATLRAKGYFDDAAPHKLLILGDLMDRGAEAVELQNFVLELMARDEVILIRGNHEDLLEALVVKDGGMPYSYHVENGTYDTALQLTGYDRATALAKRREFTSAVMETPFYKEIMPAMIDYFETENYVFTHGWIPCYANHGEYRHIEEWREASHRAWESARWINGMAAATMAADSKTVVCGHWHTSFGHARIEGKGTEFGPDADFGPYHGKGVIALDACTVHSKQINCLIIEDEPVIRHVSGALI